MKKKVLILNVLMQKCLRSGQFKELWTDFEFIMPDVKQFLREHELLEYAGKIDGIIAGDDEFTREVLEAYSPRLKVISKWGVGLDSIDLEAAKLIGIPVYNSPGAFSDAVAEVALGYMLMLSRHLLVVDRSVRKGEWVKPEGEGLAGKKLGLIGFGSIGRSIYKFAVSFGMRVNAFDVKSSEMEPPSSGDFQSLNELCLDSDFLCLCCNLTLENRHLLKKEVFESMKQKPFIINVARGPLIDENALVDALKSGLVRGAALDVFENEPLSPDSDLIEFSNVILGSHNANNLKSANDHVNANTVKNLVSAFG